MFHFVWGHAITDDLRRLWFLKSDIFKKHFRDCKAVYVDIKWPGSNDAACRKNFCRILEILEIDYDKFLPITQPTQFEEIIYPDEAFCFKPNSKFTEEYQAMIDCVRNFALKNRTATSAKKIYYFHRNEIGEERLAQYLNSKGYEIVHPELLTLEEQLNLLINCESFASTIGSSSHNSVFLRDNAEVILIPRAPKRFTGHQTLLNQLHPLNINYVDCSLSLFAHQTWNFCFIISEPLKKFFGDEFNGYEEDDFKNFLQYIQRSGSWGFQINKNAFPYYAPIYQDFINQLGRRKDLLNAYGIILV